MLVVSAVTGLDKGKAGKCAGGEIAEECRDRGNVVRIDAERVPRVPTYARLLGWKSAGLAFGVLIHVLIRVGEVGEVGRGIGRICRAGAVIVIEAEGNSDRVVDLPRYFCPVKLLEDVLNDELR